jgi:glycosyltransferase involved in cell wall biosynthesis
VKRGTLVERYHVEPDRIAVVRHGVNRLDPLVTVSGFPDDREATETACRQWLSAALCKAVGSTTAPALGAARFRFLFYASQFRPNKNLLTLLRAYQHLREAHDLGHKLILTGHPAESHDVRDFVEDARLLTARELAACYRLADLAVNPSLSEGGCPFTFGEAMSVETPVLMARIPVTEEVIGDERVRDAMLFDPYDWHELAERILWAVSHRDELYALQKPVYEEIVARTWDDVVGEYVGLLASMAHRSPAARTGS